MTAEDDWFDRLPPEEQERLDTLTRNSILRLDRYPRDLALAAELLAWSRLEVEVTEAHADWLAATKAKFEKRGIDWTTSNLNRYSRLWGVE